MIGCTDDEPVSVPNAMEQSAKENEHRVSLQDALKRAESLLSQIGDPATRSKTRKVKSVEYLQNQLTRSGAIDTTLYLVNYENNAGFALLGADDRVRPIYAIADTGRMNVVDTIKNKGLAMFFRNTETDVASLLGGGIQIDTTIVQPPIDPGIPTIEYIVARQTEPLLGVNATYLGQRYPYNIYCPILSNGDRAVVGCAAVATAQIMMYNEWPLYVGGNLIPWNQMNSIGTANYERIAFLLRLLGEPQYLNMQYGLDVSSSILGRERTILISLGYIDPGPLNNFNEENVVEILERGEDNEIGGGPILVIGNFTEEGDSHIWVIDGYLQYYKVQDHVYIPQDILYHCVWGWGGDSNGYFYWKSTESFGGEADIRDCEPYEGEYITPPYNNIKYYNVFRPNK